MMKKSRLLPGRMLGQTLRSLFNKPVSAGSLKTEPQLPPNYRGKLQYDARNCTSCQVCVYDCPVQALQVAYINTPEAKQFSLTLNLRCCIFCGQCADSCSNGCLRLSSQIKLCSLTEAELEQVKL